MRYAQLPIVNWVEPVPFRHPGEAEARPRDVYAVSIDNLQDEGWRDDGLWGLSPEMCREIVDARFVIDGYGRAACAHLWHQGFALWNDPTLKHFDTMIREMLLAPAISAIWSGFYLLEYFDRDRKQVIARMIAYAWWWKKTGRGCVAQHARVDDKRSIKVAELYEEIRQREESLEPGYATELEENIDTPRAVPTPSDGDDSAAPGRQTVPI